MLCPWFLGGLGNSFLTWFWIYLRCKTRKGEQTMADKKNLCAQIDIALHNRVTEEKDRLEMTTSQYIAALLTEYYKMKDENGGINMTGSRTMAFQIPEELRAPRKPRRTAEPPVPPQAPARPARRRRETQQTSNNNTRSQSKGPEDTSQTDASSGPFFVFPRRGVNMIQTSEKTRFTEAEMALSLIHI